MECRNCMYCGDSCTPDNKLYNDDDIDCFDFEDNDDILEYTFIGGEVYWSGISYNRFVDTWSNYLPDDRE